MLTRLTSFLAGLMLLLCGLNTHAQENLPALRPGLVWGEKPAPPTPPSTVKGGEVVGGVQITAWLDKPSVTVANAIKLHFILTNLADAPLGLNERAAEGDFDFAAKDAQGKDVPLTRFGEIKRSWKGVIISSRPRTLKKGETAYYWVLVNRLLDLSLTGNYTLTIQREKGFFMENPTIWRSNPVPLTIESVVEPRYVPIPPNLPNPSPTPSTPSTPSTPPAPPAE